MITVITGTPGSGKTLYTIQKLLLPLVGKTIEVPDEDGQLVEMPRTIYTNINGLQIDHERISDSDDGGLRNWHEWALPGSVIVFDEFQKAWPPRPNGSKVPPDVQALDTHRHMGVDFILITQNVINVDRHVHGLVGRHLHIRRVANSPMATVYEWDHCSRTLMFSKSLKFSPFFFSRKVYRLYKSAKVHTKQERSLPGVIWFVVAAVIGLAVLGPTAYARLNERIGKPERPAAAAAPAKQAQAAPAVQAREISPGVVEISGVSSSSSPAAAAAPVPPVVPGAIAIDPHQVAGCINVGTRCSCFNSAGIELDQDETQCKLLQVKRAPAMMGVLVNERPIYSPPPPPAEIHF